MADGLDAAGLSASAEALGIPGDRCVVLGKLEERHFPGKLEERHRLGKLEERHRL